MKDSALFSKAVRQNMGICIMAALLLVFGTVLLGITSESLATFEAFRPEWFDSLGATFWRILGIFFSCASVLALLLCIFSIRHAYQHYLIDVHGITCDAVVLSKNVEEVRLNSLGQDGKPQPRNVKFGHISYRYGQDGKTVDDSFILSDAEISLFELIDVGDQIPVRILPHKPHRSMLHREKLHQQYQWKQQDKMAAVAQTPVLGAALLQHQ